MFENLSGPSPNLNKRTFKIPDRNDSDHNTI